MPHLKKHHLVQLSQFFHRVGHHIGSHIGTQKALLGGTAQPALDRGTTNLKDFSPSPTPKGVSADRLWLPSVASSCLFRHYRPELVTIASRKEKPRFSLVLL
jgi:hypothetical protein